MLSLDTLKGAACATILTATALCVSPSAKAAVVPDLPTDVDSAYILPGANADSWAPGILGQIDPWATDGELVPQIDANYITCKAECGHVIRYPRTAGPLFGPNAPSADESIAIAIDLISGERAKRPRNDKIVVAGLSLGSITADAVQRSLDADPNRPPPGQVTFIVSGDPSRVTPVSTGIGSFLPVGFRIPILGWTVTRPPEESTYNTVVVVGEYDITADFPDRPWNVLALVNAVFGFEYAHSQSALTDPDDVPKENITVTKNSTGATTTTYLVRDPELPMLKPLDAVLPKPVINAANDVLKPIVDRAYSRNDAENGNRMPYLKPTDGLPRLVRPATTAPKITGSFKATPKQSALPASTAQ